MTNQQEKEFREEMKILKEPGLMEALSKAEEKGIDVVLVIKDGIKAKEAGMDPSQYVAEHRDRYRLKS